MVKQQASKLWQPKNIPDIFFTNGQRYKNKNALTYKEGHRYHKLTYGELYNEIIRTALALQKLGIKKGDHCLVISENRPEWVIIDVAAMSIGAITVPVHKNLSSLQVSCILEETKPSTIFFSDETAMSAILNSKIIRKYAKHFISFENIKHETIDVIAFNDFINSVSLSNAALKKVEQKIASVDLNDVATVVYTSGTTGKPKGAQLTHNNFIFVAMRAVELLGFSSKDVFLSILPLSHIFERLAGNFLPFYAGSSIVYCNDVTNFSADLKRFQPTVILAVPRLFEKIYNQVRDKVSQKFITKKLFALAMEHISSTDFLAKLYNRLIFSRIQNNLGGRIRVCVAGGAALNPDIIYFFNKIGVSLVEGYGLTETTSALAANGLTDNRVSTVGRPFKGLKVKLAIDGEILIKGDSVMVGYINPEDNRESFTKDGFFRTGDLGKLDSDGYLSITGRKKDIQVLTTGEKIVPVPIENLLTSSPYIEQALVIGDGYKHIAAIIVINNSTIRDRLGLDTVRNLINNKLAYDFLSEHIIEITKDLPKTQQIRKFVLTNEVFSLENDQATASMKPRRQAIIDYYAREIEDIYR